MRGQRALGLVLQLLAVGTLLAMLFRSVQLPTGGEQTAFVTGATGAFLVVAFLVAARWVRS